MPELPEVETVVRGLRPEVEGRKIIEAHVLHKPSVEGSPRALSCLRGRNILKIFRRGKFIRFSLDGNLSIAVHLRMTGWMGTSATAPVKSAEPHLRVYCLLDNGKHLLFRDIRTFGRVWVGSTDEIESLPSLAKLGPEPLLIDVATFTARLRECSGGVKALLLNQKFLAGVGNIYADETLYAARIHPQTSAAKVSRPKAAALHAAIQRILAAAIECGGSSVENFRDAEGQEGWFQRELLAYGREGEPCSRCKTPIKRIVSGQRGTWFCPRCQTH